MKTEGDDAETNSAEAPEIIVALSAQQVEALVWVIAASPMRDVGLDALAWELTGSGSEGAPQGLFHAASVFASAQDVIRAARSRWQPSRPPPRSRGRGHH